jgi:endoglucanase
VINDFRDAWLNAKKGIAKTPKGLHYPSWSKWGNLRYSNNAAFMMLVHAKHAKSPAVKTANIAWAKSQVDYALGSSGRSYVVGHGPNYPLKPHHAASSCPSKPAACNWATFSSNVPNANILYGALVGGPAGPGDDTYNDRRDDYVTNEVAVDYNSGFTGALAGLVQMLK